MSDFPKTPIVKTPSKKAYKVSGAGCVVYRKKAGRVEVLLARRKDSLWMVPRGKMAQGEKPRAAAVREVFEETGIKVKPSLEIGSYSYPIGKARYKFVQFFAATAVSGTPTPDNKEFSEVSWLSIEDAISKVSPREAVLLESVSAMIEEKVLW
jgi:8-oxo-dGTP diphosphatase